MGFCLWTSYVSDYFYCSTRPEGLLYDVERELLVIVKFHVLTLYGQIKTPQQRASYTAIR